MLDERSNVQSKKSRSKYVTLLDPDSAVQCVPFHFEKHILYNYTQIYMS